MTNEPSYTDQVHTVVARVIRQEGHCGAGHQVGDEVILDGQTVQGRVCLDAMCAFLPWVLALRYGARFPWQEDKEAVICACPDAANPVIFELRRVRPVTSASLRVALAQVAAGPEREDNVAHALRLMADASQAGAQLIVFPEMSVDRFFPQYRAEKAYFDWGEPVPGRLTGRFQEQAARLGLATVINLFERAAPGRYYDCSPVFDVHGNYLGKQRMTHILEGPGYNERYYYWPGDSGYPVFDVGPAHLGVAICYDRHFPEVMRALALGGAELVVVPTATAGLEAQFRAVWEIEMQAAAVANGLFVAVVNRAGMDDTLTFFGGSFVVDPYGRVLARAPEDDVALLLVGLDLDLVEQARRDMPFLRDRRPDSYGPLVK